MITNVIVAGIAFIIGLFVGTLLPNKHAELKGFEKSQELLHEKMAKKREE